MVRDDHVSVAQGKKDKRDDYEMIKLGVCSHGHTCKMKSKKITKIDFI